MARGPSTYLCAAWLNALGNATSFSVAQVYVKLHVGDPGSAGASNAATETTRKAASFATTATGTLTSDADISYASILGSQDATDFSMWDSATVGNFLGSGTITANGYIAGDTYVFPSGSFTVVLTPAS